MYTRLLELWIINKAGICLLHVTHKNSHSSVDLSDIFSGFFSALEYMSEESLDSITMKDSRLIVLIVEHPTKLFLVGRAPLKSKKKRS